MRLLWVVISVGSLLILAILNAWVEARRKQRIRGFEVKLMKGNGAETDDVPK